MTKNRLVALARLRAEHFLSDVAIIARSRSAIVDVKTILSKSRKLVTELQRLVELIVGPSIKIDPY